jgi:predicted secreted protein
VYYFNKNITYSVSWRTELGTGELRRRMNKKSAHLHENAGTGGFHIWFGSPFDK